MMVEGSPRRLTVATSGVHIDHPPSPSVEDDKRGPQTDRGDSTSQLPFRRPERPNSISVQHQGHSRWKKLRTTVQLGGAVTHPHKKPSLKREDSFLKRFSTRQPAVAAERESTPLRWRKWIRATVLNPDESLLFWWLWVLTACVLYNSWTLIVRQAFPELQAAFPVLWYAADGCSDLVFLLDVAFQFRTGYLEQGIMVRDSRHLARHYFTSRAFVLDMLALAPLDLAQMWLGPAPLLRLPRFLKAHRTYRFYYTVESRTAYPNLWRVANLIHVLLLLAHWFGCFYYMLSELENFKGSWSYPHPEKEYSTLIRKYLGSVYWSTLTLTTIGDLATPVTNLQYLFTIVSYLIGVFIFATIVGQVGNVITNRNASRLEFERLLDGAKLYMRHHKVPRGMQRRVQRWYDYSWSRGRMQGGGDIHSALGILPDKLKTELALHVNLKTLKKVTIFQECQPEFLHDLVLKMKAYIFTPGDLICRKGEVAREMFIISDGILEVINESGLVLTQMRAGDFFGEIGILNLDGFNRRTADVRSVGYSELFSLSREDVLMAMKDYPDAEEILQTMGRKRLMEARVKPGGDPSPRKEKEPRSSGKGRRIRWRSKWSKTPAEKRNINSEEHRQMEPSGQEQKNGEDRMATSVAKEIPFRTNETINEMPISRMPKGNPPFSLPVTNSPSAEVISLSDGGAILSPPRPTERDRIASSEAPSCPATDRRHFLFGTSCAGDEVSADTHTSSDTSWPSLQTSAANGDAKKDNREIPTAGVQKSGSAKSSFCVPSARSKDQPGPEHEIKNNGKVALLGGNILAKIQTDKKRNDPLESQGRKGTESESASFNACVVYGKEKVYTKDLAHLSSCGGSRGFVDLSALEADGGESFEDVEASLRTESYATTCFQPSLGSRSKEQGGDESHRGSCQWGLSADGECGKRGKESVPPHPPLLRENDLDNKAESIKRGPVFRPKMENRRSSEKRSGRKLKLSRMGEIQEEKDFRSSSKPHELQEPTTECVPPQHLFDGRATAHQAEELSPFTDGVQDYLIKVMRDVKQAMKIYVMDKEDELRRRISELEEQIKQKDEIIIKLQDMAAEIEPEAERDFLKSTSFGGNISNSEDTVCLSSSENDEVFPDELQKVASSADQRPLDIASLHLTETLSQQEDSKPTEETSESCIEEPCVELEQEDLWRVEFPAFNAPPLPLVQPSSVRKYLRRHSSVEVGTELSSYLLQDQSDSERDDCPFLKPHDQHFLARRFSESPSRPDQNQPRSFSNIVRKVFRKVKASKEAEASKSQVPVLLDTSLTKSAATSRRSSLDDNEATAENSQRAIWRQRPRRSSDGVQRPSAISGNQNLFNNLSDILTVKTRPNPRSGSEGNQARPLLRHLPTISEDEGLRRKLSPIADNEEGQTPTDLATLLNPESNRDSLINHRPTSVTNSALAEERLSAQLVHFSGDIVKGGNVVIDISESR